MLIEHQYGLRTDFDDLKPGDVFECENEIYLKIEELESPNGESPVNAVRINDGVHFFFGGDGHDVSQYTDSDEIHDCGDIFRLNAKLVIG